MKRFLSLFFVFVMMVSFTACGNKQDGGNAAVGNTNGQSVGSMDGAAVPTPDSGVENSKGSESGGNTETQPSEQKESNQTESGQENADQTANQAENNQGNADQTVVNQTKTDQTESSQEGEKNMTMNIQIGENTLTATLVENSSTEALLEMLAEGPVTIDMRDYANMEKVGPFPKSLPTNDEPISTDAGDLILYLGSSFVIYYDTNSWDFTRLGKIDNITQQELKDILGSGGVTVVLSLPTE